ncbi:hypothetical protein SAMN04488591_2338 [Microbacterium azadirachtae]|uniref:Uncharacterized protein n=1 Tax=Microbacterium azadirachtae TaxID=582680 RepID=A0A1I6I1M7_9MICO|nr:hypothetical protein [Microbacterium azadirachtae]SFR60587.1 hypothetical protein SAMN04488591_2338 [Microbacterium azadirachtae]
MLVIRDRLETADRDDRGAALVAVLIVMIVGVVAAVLVAATVMFTIQSNAKNKSTTQAFVAAESGRDQMLATVLANPCAKSIADAGSAPLYYAVSALFGPDKDHLTDACLSATATSTIQITASGKGPDGSATKIVALYQRPVSLSNAPGGTMSYFDGSFLATHANYTGDLVIRSGNYTCNSSSVITGDLWVPNGAVDLSANCTVNGNVYALGDITASGGNAATVKGNLITAGNVNLTANGFSLGDSAVPTSGFVYADGTFTLGNKPVIMGGYSIGKGFSGAGVVGKPTQTVANCSTSPTPAANASLCGSPAAKPGTNRTNPTLVAVTAMTTWRNLGSARAAWGSKIQWTTGPCNGSNVSSLLAAAPTPPNTRVGIDFSSCTGTVTVNIGATGLVNDAVMLIASGSPMNVNVSGPLTSSAPSLATAPQLFFIHADANLTDTAPSCGSGSASDALTLPSTVQARLMFYTPCGLNNSSQNGLIFQGQYYANNDGTPHWVHPDFTCTPMSWSPVIDLGCKVATAAGSPGTTITTILPPTLTSEQEVAP